MPVFGFKNPAEFIGQPKLRPQHRVNELPTILQLKPTGHEEDEERTQLFGRPVPGLNKY